MVCLAETGTQEQQVDPVTKVLTVRLAKMEMWATLACLDVMVSLVEAD